LQASDPLAYLTPPAGTGGTLLTLDATFPGTGQAVVTPGTYEGISIVNAFTRNVHFNAGTYVITGPDGLSFQGQGHVFGTGVTFYLTGGAIQFATTQRVRLTAPTNGAYPGILFFQDPGNASTATITGSTGSHLQGALYFPNATLNINGAGTGAAYMILVAKTLNLNTNISFSSDYTSLPNGSPIKSAVLVQ
jgi:hypothetical protein